MTLFREILLSPNSPMYYPAKLLESFELVFHLSKLKSRLFNLMNEQVSHTRIKKRKNQKAKLRFLIL